MPNVQTYIPTTSVHPSVGVGFGTGPGTPSAGDLLQEDGTSFFVLENGSGIIILQ